MFFLKAPWEILYDGGLNRDLSMTKRDVDY